MCLSLKRYELYENGAILGLTHCHILSLTSLCNLNSTSDLKAAVTHALFLAVPPKRSLRFRRCLGNGGGVSYALVESLDFATPKICERNLRYRGSALAEPAW